MIAKIKKLKFEKLAFIILVLTAFYSPKTKIFINKINITSESANNF